MANIKDIISKVEYVKEGWSDSKSPTEWKDLFGKRTADKERAKEPESPVRKDLAQLQDNGLGQKMPTLPDFKLIGSKGE